VTQPAGRRVAAVQRALSVLDELAAAQVDLGTNELARRTGINASSVSRLLATLGEAGVVEHMPETGRYRLGLRLLELGNSVLERLDIRTIARIALAAQAAYGEDLDPQTRGRLRRDYLALLARGEVRKRRYPEARRALREAGRAAPLAPRERVLGLVAGIPGLRAALGRRDPRRS